MDNDRKLASNATMNEELKKMLTGPSAAVLRYEVTSDSETVTMRPIHEIKDLAQLLPDCTQRQKIFASVFKSRAVASHYCNK